MNGFGPRQPETCLHAHESYLFERTVRRTRMDRTQRSWMAAYGPTLTFALVVVGLGALLFTTVPAAVNPTPPPAPPLVDLKKEGDMKAKQTEELVKKAVEVSGGNWDKVPAELQSPLNTYSSGHGPQLMKMYVEREAKKKLDKEKNSKK